MLFSDVIIEETPEFNKRELIGNQEYHYKTTALKSEVMRDSLFWSKI